MKKTDTKQRLFEVMSKVDKSFKLNENDIAAMGQITDKQIFDSIVNSDDKAMAIESYKEYIPILNDEYIHYIIYLAQDKDVVIDKILKYRGNIDSEVAYSLLMFSNNPMKIAKQIGAHIINQLAQEDIENIISKKFSKRPDEAEEFMSFLGRN